MASLVPVTTPADDRRLAPWIGCALSFSRLLDHGGAGAAVDDRLAAFVEHCDAPHTTWVGRVRGHRDEVGYVLDVVGAPGRQARSEPRRSLWTIRRAELVATSGPGLLTLLDAVATARCELVLVQVDTIAVEDVYRALSGDDDPTAAAHARALVLRERGSGGAVVAHGDAAFPVASELPSVHAALAVLPRIAAPPRRRRWITATAVAVPLLIVATTALALTWQHGTPGLSTTPPAVGAQASAEPPLLGLPQVRFGAGAAYDQRHRRVVLFGGVGGDDQTWLWNGSYWNQARAAASPPGRFGAAMAYDPRSGLVVMYGGHATHGGPLGDTWTWDGQTWSQVPTPSAPDALDVPVMTYDEARQTVVLVSGCCGRLPPQTWTWDAGGWVQANPPTPAPLELASAMAYDPRTRTVLLVGAAQGSGGAAATWAWNGVTWAELHPAHVLQAGVTMSLVADPASGELLLLNTVANAAAAPAVQVFRWDGADWTDERPSTVPSNMVAAVSDTDRGLVVAFGHEDTSVGGALTTEWGWTGSTWVVLSAPADLARSTVRPSPRFETAMAFDPARGELVVFGGGAVSNSSRVDLGDTWTWNGTTWTQRAPPTSPAPRQGAMLAYDPGSQSLLMYGGYVSTSLGLPPLEETWRWDGTTWTQLHPPTSPPAGSTVDGLVYDEQQHTMVLVTSCCDVPPGIGPGAPRRLDTWTWDGDGWVQRHPFLSPPSPGPAAMAYDPAHGIVLAVVAGSGADGVGSTWSWDGDNWQRVDPGSATIIDWLTATVTPDPASGRVLLVERSVNLTLAGGGGVETWNGRNWVPQPPGDGFHPDTARHASRPFVDTSLGRVVIIGGPFDDFSHTWMFTGTTWVELDQVGASPPQPSLGIAAGPRVLHR